MGGSKQRSVAGISGSGRSDAELRPTAPSLELPLEPGLRLRSGCCKSPSCCGLALSVGSGSSQSDNQ